MSVNLKEKILLLPDSPGVYKFYNKNGEIIYIGKAHSLRNRVSSYFKSDHRDRPRIISMIPLIADLEVTQTDNDIEALILESALIKQNQPEYNSMLKDDKSYAWLYVITKSRYPTVKIVRTTNKSEFINGKLFGPYPSGKTIKRVFNYIRKLYPFCTSKDPSKPCFYSRIGLCPGPDASEEVYQNNIKGIINLLKGRNYNQLRVLAEKMRTYAQNRQYERAAEIRDRINDLKYLGSEIKFNYFGTEEEYVESREERMRKQLNQLQKILGLEKLNRVECYDISNIQGKMSYGSMVVSINGVPTNRLYRIFKIRSMDTPNDYLMLAEVLSRRIKHINGDKDESLTEKPDLIIIDGGKGQLSAVHKIIPSGIAILGITKGRKYKRKGGKKKDEFWIYNNGTIEQLKIGPQQSISILRDEAHRFAIIHHRKLRKFMQKKSILDEIKGVGAITKKKLIKAFGSVEQIRGVSLEEIDKVIHNKKISEAINSALKRFKV
ncbi:MAG: Excinuclease ABC, C subunit [candidate division WS6 bacterium GW2011_GWF2_39_15]|uniref:Excinuclease ABC, C subunit n=1 Tax=candidate division WS6 bacterium GW2011_GWF2_39_15 TaxID=1619100 RepID=A0A0G0MPU1_9BACT|nr:MAG: Excinuclease ABC, C subunit [candidate division WS6 bacterium GW2011_GWF2_39_15]